MTLTSFSLTHKPLSPRRDPYFSKRHGDYVTDKTETYHPEETNTVVLRKGKVVGTSVTE